MNWNVPSYRIRAYVRRKKNSRPRPKKAELRFSLKRSTAEVSVIEGIATTREVVKASILLNDLSIHGAFLFTEHALSIGQYVRLTVNHPRYFFVHGRVVTCKMLSMRNNVISPMSFPYRLGILFEFGSEKEYTTVKAYLEELSIEHLKLKVAS